MSTIQEHFDGFTEVEKAEKMIRTVEDVGKIVEQIVTECIREKYQQCCHRKPSLLITYDCAPEESQTILVCQHHYSDEPFRSHIIRKEILD